MFNLKRRGFTIVEMLIVLGIIVIISAIVSTANFFSVSIENGENQAQRVASNISNTIDTYSRGPDYDAIYSDGEVDFDDIATSLYADIAPEPGEATSASQIVRSCNAYERTTSGDPGFSDLLIVREGFCSNIEPLLKFLEEFNSDREVAVEAVNIMDYVGTDGLETAAGGVMVKEEDVPYETETTALRFFARDDEGASDYATVIIGSSNNYHLGYETE